MVQLGAWGASKVGGVQCGCPRGVNRIQVTCRCHLRKERGPGEMARAPSGGSPRPLSPALTWPGRLDVDFSGVRRLLGMSDW